MCLRADYLRHPQYGGLLMAAFGIAIITRSETRLAMAAVLWFVLHQKVRRVLSGGAGSESLQTEFVQLTVAQAAQQHQS